MKIDYILIFYQIEIKMSTLYRIPVRYLWKANKIIITNSNQNYIKNNIIRHQSKNQSKIIIIPDFLLKYPSR